MDSVCVMTKLCSNCGESIPSERLELLPNTSHCIKCVDKHGPKKVWDPEVVCAKASPSGQNGWSPSS